MKKVIFISIFSVFVSALNAQVFQKQYLFNTYVINPAAAGEHSFSPLYIGFRQQFAGHAEAPKTLFTSYNGMLSDNVGLGLQLLQDESPTLSIIAGKLSYSYDLQLSKQNNLSFGLSAVAFQFQGDYSDAVVVDLNDPLMSDVFENTIAVDADFGMMLKNPNYFFGASVYNLFKTKLYFGQASVAPATLSRGALLHGGYHVPIGKQTLLTPSFLIRKLEEVSSEYDLNATFSYKEMLKVGFSYQNQNAFGAHFGLQYHNMFVAYMFDLNNTAINKPSHELMFGYFKSIGESKKQRLKRLKKEKELRKHKDTDGDGVKDYLDDCPNCWGLEKDNGCPKISQELSDLLSEIQLDIYFVDNDVSEESMPALMKLGSLMLINQGVKLRVLGEFFQVKIVSEYLLNRWSIPASRIEYEEGESFNLDLFAD